MSDPWQSGPGVGSGSTFGSGQMGGDALLQRPARTSILAVASLVFGIVCCLPFTGPIAIALGGASIVAVGKSQGRLSGRPLAITGLILGVISSAIWIFGLIGAMQVWNNLRQSVTPMMTTLQGTNTDEVKKIVTGSVASSLSDAQILQFSSEFQATLGKVQGLPASLLDVISFYSTIGATMPPEYLKAMQAKSANYLPLPVDFEKGRAIILLELPMTVSATNNQSGLSGMITNVIVIAPDGTQIKLVDPNRPGAGPETLNKTGESAPGEGTTEKKKPGF